jgi:hypothetical protein
VLTSPTTVACSVENARCSYPDPVTGIGTVTYDCTCSLGLWQCTSGGSTAVACPIGVLTPPAGGEVCDSSMDSSCSLAVATVLGQAKYVCACGTTWICSIQPG